MIQKWEKRLDKYVLSRALQTDLSKAFDCLPDYLLIAKIRAYRFDKNSTGYLFELSLKKMKVNKALSNWTNILHKVPQGFIFDQLLFNVVFFYLFLFIPNTNLLSYGHDNKPFLFGFRIIV